MALAVAFTCLGDMSVNAATPEAISEPVISGDNGQMEFLEISEEEVAVEEVPETRLNATDREYADEQFTVSEEGVPYSQRDTVPNTDPNYAYLAQNDVVYQGAIETEKEFRWYAFEIKEKSKITILLQMVETLDADLIMFSLDTETSTLNAINGSAAGGAGVTEYYANVLEPGIYYFTVTGYEGTGQFAFAFFQSSLDANYEVNDTSATATSVALDSSYMGIIDSPYDVDYYKLSVERAYIMNYSITSTNGYSMLLAGKSGDNAGIFKVADGSGNMLIMPGTYYFAVLSQDDKYSVTSTYNINFRTVYTLAADSSANLIGICSEAGIVFQTNSAGSVYYVNGNPININYSYSNSSSNSGGSQSYNISITDRSDVYVYLLDDVPAPSVIYYRNSTRPAMNVGSKAALELTFYSQNEFYNVHCRCTGAYAENNLWKEFKAVTVIIDPATGRLIDIEQFNYFYDFAQGSNSLSFTRPYSDLKLYKYGN